MSLEQEIIRIPSSHSVSGTTDRLDQALQAKGFRIFLRLDQKAQAETVGLTMAETELLVFGNPEIGTRLMNEHPSIALDLPLRLLVQEGNDGNTVVIMNSPAYIAQRHGIDQPIFGALEGLLKAALDSE